MVSLVRPKCMPKNGNCRVPRSDRQNASNGSFYMSLHTLSFLSDDSEHRRPCRRDTETETGMRLWQAFRAIGRADRDQYFISSRTSPPLRLSHATAVASEGMRLRKITQAVASTWSLTERCRRDVGDSIWSTG